MPFVAINPSTGEPLYEVPTLDAPAREALLERLATQQQRWRLMSLATRVEFTSALAGALRVRRESLAQALTREMGKPIVAARAEVDKCILLCEQSPALAEQALRAETVLDDAIATVTVFYEPLGVVLAIMPWNFPYWQALRFAIPALLAGNGVLIKPAPSVPGSAQLLAACINDAQDTLAAHDIAPAPCEVALIDQDHLAAIIADPRIAGVTLTGSDRAGRAVAQLAGAQLKKVVLELGGSDPFIVLPDADVARAAAVAVTARTVNSGQSCIAAKRFIVCDAVYEEFLERFSNGMRALVVGDPSSEQTQVGPIATASVRDLLAAQVRESVRDGARLVLGGDHANLPGFFYPPTILADIPSTARAAHEELFGPVASVIRALDIEHAIALANASPFGLGASVWTTNAQLAADCAARLDVGMVFINDMVVSDARVPFGGIKQSGVGRELGTLGYREFTNQKSVRVLLPLASPQ